MVQTIKAVQGGPQQRTTHQIEGRLHRLDGGLAKHCLAPRRALPAQVDVIDRQCRRGIDE